MIRPWTFLPLCALPVLAVATPLDDARTALDSGFAQVALVKLEEHFPTIGLPQSHPEANLLYARALIAADQTDAAILLLKSSPNHPAPDSSFWLAQAHAADGDWEDALANYTAAAESPDFALHKEAVIGLARMLGNLGRLGEAAAALAPATSWPASRQQSLAFSDLAEICLAQDNAPAARDALAHLSPSTPAEKTRRDFLLARIAVLENNDAAAIELLAPLVPTDVKMAVHAVLLQADALTRSGRSSDAETLLEEFLATHPSLPGLDRLFVALDEIYAGSASASSSELQRWSEEKEPTLRKKLSTYYLARLEARQNNPRSALPLLEQLAADPATNPLARETMLELAALRVRLGLNAEALALLPEEGHSPHTDFLRGLALSRTGEHTPAAAAFSSAARDPNLAESALFNAALCELYAGKKPNTALATLKEKYPRSTRSPTFHLQEAFHLARTGDPLAREAFEKLAASPTPAIASRARLALAEWKYLQLDFPGATRELARISTKSDPASEAALQVFLADNEDPAADDQAIASARAFLSAHAGSESEPSVRMKLGELLFRKGDFATARVELDTLARKFPETEYDEPALFLSAQAASRIPSATAPDEALLLFEEVAALDGPLAARARLEQASILTAQGKPLEANVVLDKILASTPDRDLKATALIEKGKNLYSLGDTDPANHRAAIDVWKQVSSEEAADPAWRNQALVRIGTALEKSGDPNGAVACYYDVFKPTEGTPKEFFWFHKAGFAAGRILESQEKWPEAVRVYELMAATEGPRALEARNRIKKIRLEHFLWEE
jgi:predicted negative regulator of RcsB-dependent stress response